MSPDPPHAGRRTARVRLDALLVARGLAESREQARRRILAGAVRVNEQRECKAARQVPEDARVLLVSPPRFVSRGGEKLEGALTAFELDVHGWVCLDVGASTGGFSDCLLQHGAKQVLAVDVGRGQLHWRLRSDPRVVPIEGCNARYLTREDLPECPSFAVVDVSFISLRCILPALAAILPPGSGLVTLVKPQFEAGRAAVGRGGVVRDPAVHAQVIEKIKQFGTRVLGWCCKGMTPSPLVGPSGNREFFLYWIIGASREIAGADDRLDSQP